jgi:hypothetical protein
MGVRTPSAGVGDAGATAACNPFAQRSSAAMAMAMATAAAAGRLLHLPALPPSGLASSSSPLPAPTRTLPPSNCSTSSATSFIVSGEPRTVRGARRVATLRVAGSELAAPSPVRILSSSTNFATAVGLSCALVALAMRLLLALDGILLSECSAHIFNGLCIVANSVE